MPCHNSNKSSPARCLVAMFAHIAHNASPHENRACWVSGADDSSRHVARRRHGSAANAAVPCHEARLGNRVVDISGHSCWITPRCRTHAPCGFPFTTATPDRIGSDTSPKSRRIVQPRMMGADGTSCLALRHAGFQSLSPRRDASATSTLTRSPGEVPQ